jgi:hypothetical protein
MSTLSDFTVRQGDRGPFVLTWNPSHEPPPKTVDAEHALADTLRFWTGWTAKGNPVRGPYRDPIRRSLLTLKALTYQPTGGIVAAPTTSLPEQIGGSRNWDYRYCWLAGLHLHLASPDLGRVPRRGEGVARMVAARRRR